MRPKVDEERLPPFRIRRKIFHLILGTVFILAMLTLWQFKWFFLAVLSFGVILSFVQERYHLPVITWMLDRYDKETDVVPGEGPLSFFLGSVLTWFIFPPAVAIPAVMALTFGDPLAYLFGRRIGGPSLPWNSKKTVSGLIGFMLVPSLTVTMIYGPIVGIPVAILGGIVESVDWRIGLLGDDNVTVPLFSSTLLWLFLLLTGYL